MGTFPQENSLRFSHDRPHHVVYPGPPRTPTPAFKTIPSVDVLQLRTPSKLFLLFFFFLVCCCCCVSTAILSTFKPGFRRCYGDTNGEWPHSSFTQFLASSRWHYSIFPFSVLTFLLSACKNRSLYLVIKWHETKILLYILMIHTFHKFPPLVLELVSYHPPFSTFKCIYFIRYIEVTLKNFTH